MKTFKRVFVAALSLSAFFFFACSAEDDGLVYIPPKNVSTVHVVSSGLSDYTKKSVSALGYSTYSTSSDKMPDVFVFKGSDAAKLSSGQIELLVKSFLQGNTVIIDSPTIDNVIAFGRNLDSVLAASKNKALKAKCELGAYSIYDVVRQMEQLKTKVAAATNSDASYLQRKYEAIAIRKKQIYYVHAIDEAVSESAMIKSKPQAVKTLNSENESWDKVKAKTGRPLKETTADYKRVTSDSITNFSNWLSKKSVSAKISAARSDVPYQNFSADPKDAQSFIHNFTAAFNVPYRDHYDGRFEGRNENVEVRSDVWAFCSIDNNTDWYYVRTSVICHNEQLNVQNTWDDDKYVSPYFDKCSASVVLGGDDSLDVRTQDCQPQNQPGSTSFTTGMSVNIGGNVGISSTGPSGGISGGVTFSNSTTQSIPDIDVNFTTTSDKTAVWTDTAATVEPGWSGLYTECPDPKEIQKRMAIFDNYAVYTLGSSCGEDDGTLMLKTTVSAKLTMITGWLSGFLDTTLNWYWYSNTTSICYYDFIKKPSNACAKYLMYFDAPSGSSPEKIELWNNVLKEYISDWDSLENYYAVGSANLDSAAKSYFASVKDKITANKDVLKSRGFEGTFTFYVKEETSPNLDSFSETF